jgi:SSS family solute:Na+ symporter
MNFSALDYTVFFVIILIVIIVSFLGARWRKADLKQISEWSVGGRRFGTIIVWFLMGGDIYTAYSLISIPGGAFSSGGLILYATVYGAISYPFLYFVAPRLYLIAKKHNFITGADYVNARYNSRVLSLLIAITGLLAMLPYIALQVVGIKYVLEAMKLPIIASFIIAFLIVAAFTVVAGLRGPALGSIIKDIVLWAIIIVVLVVLWIKFAGFGPIFSTLQAQAKPVLIPGNLMIGFITLAFGNGVAWLLFPNLLTGIFGSKSAKIIKKNSILLPVYQIWLMILAIFGLVALAKNLVPSGVSSLAFPSLMTAYFPSTFVVIAFSAIIIGSMVPASLQALAAANLITRNIYLEFFNKTAPENKQVFIGRIFVVVMIFASLIFAIVPAASGSIFYLLTMSYAWLLQTLPAIIMSMYWKKLDKYSTGIGWAAGFAVVTWGLFEVHFSSSLLPTFGYMYVGILGLMVNLAVLFVVRGIMKWIKYKGSTKLQSTDYTDSD